ncbi:MAG TPA: phosphoribosylformylglycinamidine synthase subunit PurL, partial [Mycobacteriales bacterium]|nr:phosphoribosylformylglycinamidine synthase subunit PurL [Mycobacteriales bacterium]
MIARGTGQPTVESLDTVAVAAADPDLVQPYADLGLQPDEYDRIRDVLGRRPTGCELAMYSVMWSEHCSYKSSRVHFRHFADLPRSERLLAGIGENAGVIAVSDELAVTFKVESHNHPSYVEPYQGAATGVGGIVRDILAMGARPVAVMDSLRFGDVDHPDTRRVVGGVVAGIGGYGNCLGLPNIGGEIAFDPSYNGNPLVNALCLGVLPRERLQTSKATGVGNKVILYGARTGRDGIGGVSVLASATFDDDGPARRPAVQVGDPFTEKIVTEASLEMYARGLVIGIQDLGGAGFTCAISETAAAGGQGMHVTLDAVPLREPSMQPWEVLSSESQERMLAIVAPADVDEVLAVCRRWGVLATVVGEVTDTGRLVVDWHGSTVVDVPPGSLADDGPVYHRPLARPAWLDDRQADRAEALPRPAPAELAAEVLKLVAAPNLAGTGWVTDQYDRYVLSNTVLAMPEDAGLVRIGDGPMGVALALDGPARFAALDPYAGAQLAVAEAARNVACSGARPVAVSDCLNFGSPEDPSVMWQFAEAVRGIADACRVLGLPVTGGNVSFYNQTGDKAINPTPVIGVLGVIDDVSRHTPIGFAADGDVVLLLGETREEFGGSEWAWVAHRHLGGLPPAVDLAHELRLHELLVSSAADGLLRSAHDC